MPRKKNKETTEQKRIRQERDAQVSDFWTRRIQAAKEVKRDYMAVGDEVLSYFKAHHRTLYMDPEIKTNFMDLAGSANVSVPKIAQMVNSIGPRLFLTKPDRRIRPRTDDGVMLCLARLFQAYLNYTVRESKHPKQLRKSILDNLTRGRMFQRQIWDPIRKIITSIFLPSKDFLFDPDFQDIESARWIAIRHTEPLWETKRRIPQAWRTKDLEKLASCEDKDADKQNRTADVVEYWEILSKMGAGFRGADMKNSQFKEEDENEDFVRLEIVAGHRCPLMEGDWDVPLYLDRDWPVSYSEFVETPEAHWPESIAGQVIACQKGIDLLTSLRMSSCKNRDRTIIFTDSKISQQAQNRLKNGTASEFIPIDLPSGMTMDMVLKVADFGQGSAESARERAYLEQEIEAAMGTTSLVTGGEDAGAKDRSATASQLRNEASSTRLGDLKAKVAEFEEDAARKEAAMIRLFLSQEDVEPYVRMSDLRMFYVKVEVPGGATIPVRDLSGDALSLAQIYPPASTYFEKPEMAYEAAVALWQEIAQAQDPRLVEIGQTLASVGMDPMSGLPTGIQVAVVDVERVWQDTAGMTAEEVLREMHYEIASGAGIRWDRTTEQKNVDELLQTTLPIMLQNMDYAGANQLLRMRDEAYDVPEDKRVTLEPPPPPPPTEAAPPEKEDE